MKALAAALVVLLVPLFAWAWRVKPGRAAADQFVEIWRLRPWGKQLTLDFVALEVVLAMWMLDDAAVRGVWWPAGAAIATMPILGAMPAALYWMLR